MGEMNIGGYKVILEDKNGTAINPMNVNYDLENMIVTVKTNIIMTGEKISKGKMKEKVVRLFPNDTKDTESVLKKALPDQEMNARMLALANKLAKEKGADDHEEKKPEDEKDIPDDVA